MSQLRIGTCSWKFDSWIGLVYSEGVGKHYLREYAGKYNSVEVDQWFWSLHGVDTITLPRDKVVREYVDSVTRDFRFTVKVPNSITLTHFYRQAKSEPLAENPHFLSPTLFERFLSSLVGMEAQLGMLIFQFEYLNKKKMPSQDEFQRRFTEFFRLCDRRLPSAVEIRNPKYLNDDYFRFLQANGLSAVFLQGYFMPPITEIYDRFGGYLQAPAVIRLHGPDREGMEEKTGGRWNRLVVHRDEELDAICEMVNDLLHRNLDVYLNVNNHYEGSAPLTIERIKERLAG
ncbi:MAG: DUF72 domain-containing protein [Acidobacteria bacterium]|nr:DUF72 domain-containing protein [Acidobacteriota bacterium]